MGPRNLTRVAWSWISWSQTTHVTDLTPHRGRYRTSHRERCLRQYRTSHSDRVHPEIKFKKPHFQYKLYQERGSLYLSLECGTIGRTVPRMIPSPSTGRATIRYLSTGHRLAQSHHAISVPASRALRNQRQYNHIPGTSCTEIVLFGI
eukprot:3026652-Rhodomonas_salina.2